MYEAYKKISNVPDMVFGGNKYNHPIKILDTDSFYLIKSSRIYEYANIFISQV